jgi:hypothetical protein
LESEVGNCEDAEAAVTVKGSTGANSEDAGPGGAERSALPASALSIITSEHFALQEARSATISESVGRASMFLTAVSGGLVALGLMATATRVGSAFYAFGLALLPTLSFIGLITFQRVLQSGIEDHGYAERIAQLRGFYFEQVPQLTPYMPRLPPQERIIARGLSDRRVQGFLTTAGMVAVVTAVLVGGAAGLLASVLSSHSLPIALPVGAVVAAVAVLGLTEYQRATWKHAEAALATGG